MRTRSLHAAAAVLALLGMVPAARAAYIHAKASLAQALIHRAWVAAGKSGGAPRPWPWADTRPVARLAVPARGADLMVLEGGSARTLAFGPGHVAGTAKPGAHGNAVIGGHRDTHFRFLKDVAVGDVVLVQAPDRKIVEYEVTATRVVDRGQGEIQRDFGDDRLTLVTCYPFDAIRPGGPLRYVVTALRR